MSFREEHDHEQRASDDDESLEGNWESKSETSSLSSAASQQDSHKPAPADRLEAELVDYLLKHKDEFNLERIKSLHKVATQLKGNNSCSLEKYIDHLKQAKDSAEQDLEQARKEAEKAKSKTKLLQEQLKKELSTFDKLRVDNILKNSGGIEYVEALKSTIKIKDATIKSQRLDIEHLESRQDNFKQRLTKAEKYIEEQRKTLQQALAHAKSSHDFELDRRRNLSHQGSVVLGMTEESQMDSSLDFQVPPPPPLEGDEILRLVQSPSHGHITSANSSAYNGGLSFNTTIPPPPDVEVSMDDILRDLNGSINHSGTQSYVNHHQQHTHQSMGSN